MSIRLVVFDVDGTLTDHSSIWLRLHEHFGTIEKGRLYSKWFFEGKIGYNRWAELDASLWKGQTIEEVKRVVSNTKLTTGALETITELKKNDVRLAILSGGLDVLAEDIGQRLGIDYVLTNRLHHSDGILTGGVESRVGYKEKREELHQISNHFGIPLDQIAYVGDGRNDIDAFKTVGLSIAFRPENEEVSEAAMVTVKENDLRGILIHVLS